MACSSQPPDGATSRNGARTAARRVGQRAGRPSAIQPRPERGDEHGVGPVHRPALLLVEPDDDLGHVAGGQDAEGADGEVDRLAGVVDGDALAPHQPERLVHRAQRVRAQRRGAQDLAGPDVHLDAAPLPVPEVDLDAGAAGAGQRDVGPARARRGGRSLEHLPGRQRLGPARAAQLGRHRWPGDLDLLDVHPRAERGHPRRQGARSAEPCVVATRRMPVPSGRSARASGGRLGPRRTTSSRRHRTRTASPVSSARSRARAGTGLRALPPKAPPLASGGAGRPPGRLQLASGSR